MFANIGFEEDETVGLGWIPGNVIKIDNEKNKFKLHFLTNWEFVIKHLKKKKKFKSEEILEIEKFLSKN